VVHAEIRYHRVEAPIGIGQSLGVAFTELQVRMCLPRLVQHRSRKIESDRAGTALCRRSGHNPGAAADVQHLCSGGNASCVEQCLDKRRGGSREGRAVLQRRLLPPGMLEGPDGFGIESCHVAGYSIDQLGARVGGS
jgi:hypothetical protein